VIDVPTFPVPNVPVMPMEIPLEMLMNNPFDPATLKDHIPINNVPLEFLQIFDQVDCASLPLLGGSLDPLK